MEYLKATALNVIRDRWRKTKRKGAEINLEAVNPLETAVESPAEAATLRVMIEDALKKLSEDQRRVIELRIIKGFSVSRTAGMMNKKETTVRVIQYRALQALADILETKDLVKERRDNG
jgi:RNA polymerase sigma-70 factor (ECF subfamily)